MKQLFTLKFCTSTPTQKQLIVLRQKQSRDTRSQVIRDFLWVNFVKRVEKNYYNFRNIQLFVSNDVKSVFCRKVKWPKNYRKTEPILVQFSISIPPENARNRKISLREILTKVLIKFLCPYGWPLIHLITFSNFFVNHSTFRYSENVSLYDTVTRE